tara:strand:+ start:2673 stop:4253 length:1581 start_codon:yes stop_codon:yes gene_type:complete
MKNKIIIILFSLFSFEIVNSENLLIESKIVTIDKKKNSSIFKEDVFVKTSDNFSINSQYAEYDKKNGILLFKNKVKGTDDKNNIIETEHAKYNEVSNTLKTFGPTKIITSDEYIIETYDLFFDNNKNIISSNKEAIIYDQDENKIYLNSFEYLIKDNIFKSIGSIKFIDKNENSYEFSQIYIDTKKKEILGSDSKLFLNQKDFKIDDRNKPRIFSNTVQIRNEKKLFKKNIFTLCNYRKNDKCPPWTVQSNEMLHDNKKKTIYYKNAIIKVYDIPIFYIPRISHPDPSVERRSGFLPPSFEDTKNLGAGITIPYFFAVNRDKNFTLTNKFYINNHPLFVGDYHQVFKNSSLQTNFGYTQGFKSNNEKKKKGNKSHFFSEFNKKFQFNDQSESFLNLKIQEVSNDKYLKLYKLKSNLTDYNMQTLENSIDFSHENEELFFGFNSSIYETLNESYNDKYEYIYPDITLNKNLFSNNFGNLEFQSNYKIRKYDTNKFTNFLVNDFDWNYQILKRNSFSDNTISDFENIG